MALLPPVFEKNSVLYCTVLQCTVLSLYLDERTGTQGNTSIRLREFQRAQPEGTPETECWYFPVLPNSSQGTDIIQFVKYDEAVAIAIAIAIAIASA